MNYFKFPRTSHFPFSPGVSSDDKIIKNYDGFVGRRMIGTVKYDGENTTLTRDVIHARSLDSRNHPSRNWVKGFWAGFNWQIPEGYRICGENLYARHSLVYDDLQSFFYGFSVWDENNVALDWDRTQGWFSEFKIHPVETVYDGLFDAKKIEQLCSQIDPLTQEGLVFRVADEIPYDQYGSCVAKFVRAGHVQTDEHWMLQEVVPNKLREAKYD